MTETKIEEITATIKAVPELPIDRLIVYARLWQFEIWLRQMVYVELRAKYGDDWNVLIRGKAKHPRENDQSLTHMPTPEKMDLSFISFDSLIRTISEEWPLFEAFLPPQNIWDAKIKEVSQIRNRIAHFRKGHVDDYQRVIQLIRDVDKGFFKFCTSLNNTIHSLSIDSNDPIIHKFAKLNPYVRKDSLSVDEDDGIFTHFARSFEIRIDIVRRLWINAPIDSSQVIGCPGFFYDLNIHEHEGRDFDYKEILKSTQSLHEHILYISLSSSGRHVGVLLPSLLGKEILIVIIRAFIDAAANNLIPRRPDISLSMESAEKAIDEVENIADQWPEYVIGPKNPISFLDSDMECSFFGA